MTDFNIENFIVELKEAGYFKQYDDAQYGNIYRYNGLYDTFQELNNDAFVKVLTKIIGSVNAFEYWYYIKTCLDTFPVKEYKQYENYIALSKRDKLEDVEREFLRGLYKDNADRKGEGEITPNADLTKDIQLLVNADIFADGDALVRYDADNKTFIPVTDGNIAEFIGCDDSDVASKILETGLKNTSLLVNVYFTIPLFDDARQVDYLLGMNENGYRYIEALKEAINPKYEDTFGMLF